MVAVEWGWTSDRTFGGTSPGTFGRTFVSSESEWYAIQF